IALVPEIAERLPVVGLRSAICVPLPVAETFLAVTTTSWVEGSARYRGETALAISRSPARPPSGGDHEDHGVELLRVEPLSASVTATAIAAIASPASAIVTTKNLCEW